MVYVHVGTIPAPVFQRICRALQRIGVVPAPIPLNHFEALEGLWLGLVQWSAVGVMARSSGFRRRIRVYVRMKGKNVLKAALAKDIVVEKRDGGRMGGEGEREDERDILYDETVRIRGQEAAQAIFGGSGSIISNNNKAATGRRYAVWK